MLACLRQHLLTENIPGLKAVLQTSPNLINVRNGHGLSLLHLSCQFNQIETTQFLLQYAPHLLNQMDRNNSGPIFYALSHPACLKMLLDAGADIHHRDNIGVGPLQCAVIRNLLPAAEMLLPRLSSQDIDAKDYSGYTALCHAVMEGYVDMVKLLLRYGANVHATNSGLTAIEFWGGEKDLGHPVNDTIAFLLYQHGADVWSYCARCTRSLNRYRAYDHVKTLLTAAKIFGPLYDYRCLRVIADYMS